MAVSTYGPGYVQGLCSFLAHIRGNKLSGRFEFPNGSVEHLHDGKRHREDGPAVEHTDGGKYWFLHDKLHRGDGPAMEFPSGRQYWLLHGEEINKTRAH